MIICKLLIYLAAKLTQKFCNTFCTYRLTMASLAFVFMVDDRRLYEGHVSTLELIYELSGWNTILYLNVESVFMTIFSDT